MQNTAAVSVALAGGQQRACQPHRLPQTCLTKRLGSCRGNALRKPAGIGSLSPPVLLLQLYWCIHIDRDMVLLMPPVALPPCCWLHCCCALLQAATCRMSCLHPLSRSWRWQTSGASPTPGVQQRPAKHGSTVRGSSNKNMSSSGSGGGSGRGRGRGSSSSHGSLLVVSNFS